MDASADTLYFTDVGNHRVRAIDLATRVIRTFAGGGAAEIGDSGPATDAQFSTHPMRVRLDRAGHVYVTDAHQNRIRRIDRATDIITTVAGNGEEAYAGDGGPATGASLRVPHDARHDRAGNLYIADTQNHRVRRVDAQTGLITTVAGTGEAGFSEDGRPAAESRLNAPLAMDIDPEGNIYIVDTDNLRIRRIDAQTGVITTAAGCGRMGPTEDGIPAIAATFGRPRDVRIGSDGCVYVADGSNAIVCRIDPATELIHIVAGCNAEGFSGDGGPASEAELGHPYSIAFDPAGHLYMKDCTNRRIRKVDAQTDIITTIAGTGEKGCSGDGGPAVEARLAIA